MGFIEGGRNITMKSIKHWSPRYLVNRSSEVMYHRRFPDYPWLTKVANDILSRWLKHDETGLEFGSGRSTIWFAKRLSFLTSIEHDPAWHEKVSAMIKDNGLSNVDYILAEKDTSERDGHSSRYVQTIRGFQSNSLDFVLVDGVYRSSCALAVVDKLRPAGLLVLDNANWYLPCESFSPNSRTQRQGAASPEWSEFVEVVRKWRCIWTSSGVTDTALFIKPCY